MGVGLLDLVLVDAQVPAFADDLVSAGGDLDAGLAQLLDPARRFPSVDQVQDAASAFVTRAGRRTRRYLPDWQQPDRLETDAWGMQGDLAIVKPRAEGRDFLIGVAAGVVSCRMIDHERRARTAGQDGRKTALLSIPFGPVEERPRFFTSTPSRSVTHWSAKSRTNMTRALSELDYDPLFASGQTPCMMTATYPGEWESVAPSGKAVKRHVRILMLRWKRRWGKTPPYLWKLEFQRRGAPHLHFFLCLPEKASPGEFRDWLSSTWADVVAHDDPEQRRRHALAGTGIDFKEGIRARDPKRLAVYFTKHGGAAGGKEYQHQVPPLWWTAANGPGRFWGYVGLKRVRAEVYLEEEHYVQARRILRRIARSKRLVSERMVARGEQVGWYSRSAPPEGWTAEPVTRKRKVTRRRKVPCSAGGLAGGFLLVNDGPKLAKQLAAYLNV